MYVHNVIYFCLHIVIYMLYICIHTWMHMVTSYCYTVHGDNYQCITMKEELKSFSLEELRYRDIQGVTPTLVSNKESMKRHLSLSERQLEILDILLKSSCVRSTVNYLVCKSVIMCMHFSYYYTVSYRETC